MAWWNVRDHVYIDGAECKICSRCKKALPVSFYHKDSSKADGLHGFCKECTSKVNAITYGRNPERVKSNTARNYKKKHKYAILKCSHQNISEKEREKRRAYSMRHRMLAHGFSKAYQITADAISEVIKKYNGKCAYCGKECLGRYHIDHKIPVSRGGGNEIENLALSCPHCNLVKYTKTDIEFCGKAV